MTTILCNLCRKRKKCEYAKTVFTTEYDGQINVLSAKREYNEEKQKKIAKKINRLKQLRGKATRKFRQNCMKEMEKIRK